jgi:hypothetical protein
VQSTNTNVQLCGNDQATNIIKPNMRAWLAALQVVSPLCVLVIACMLLPHDVNASPNPIAVFIQLERYAEIFAAEEVDLEALPLLTEPDLTSMGITALEDKISILQAIQV